MEQWLIKIIDASPLLGAFLAFWYFQRKDYIGLVNSVQSENLKREERYQNTIDKLTDKLNIVDDINDKVEEIYEKIK